MKEVLISFIIPHKGRELFLQKTIESVIQQKIDTSLLEVIIVTQNNELTEKIKSYTNKISLNIYIRPETENISALRNFGVEKSTGKYLAFLDADVELSSNWSECMLDSLNTVNGRVITSAIQKNGTNAPPLEIIRTALCNAVTNQNVSFLPGRNLFLSRETFYQIGGFPEHLITCEDYYFTDRATKFGDLFYTSGASYIHLGEDKDFYEMAKKEIWRGQSNLLSIKGRRIPLSEVPSFIIPVGLIAFFLLGFVLLLSGYLLYAGFSFMLAIIPVVIYSSRLYRLAADQVSLFHIIKFYLYYFPARAIGTIGGAFKTFSTRSHS